MPETNCPKCGQKVAVGTAACSSCGQPLFWTTTPLVPDAQPAPPQPNSPVQTNQPPVPNASPTQSFQMYYRTARTRGEIRVLIITVALIGLLFLVGLPIAAGGFKLDTVIGGIILLFVVTAFWLFVIRLTQRQFLGNALRVERGHFSNLKGLTNQVAALLNMPEPEVYIFQDPYLNAFSLGFKRPYTVALHSAIVEDLDQEELTAVIIHEVGHIWFGHTRISAYVTPVVIQIPIVSPVMEYIFGFWTRRTELTCDRLAILVTRNPRAVIEALIKTYVGPHFLLQLDAEGVLFQEHQTQGLLNKLAQSMSTHPFMTTRIKKLLEYSRELGLTYVDKNGMLVCENCGLKSALSAAFCPRCNFPLHQPTAGGSVPPAQSPPPAPANPHG